MHQASNWFCSIHFEARGYTIWDSSSPTFIKSESNMKVLCVPTAFCAFNGLVLDEKTPLLKATDALANKRLGFYR